MGRLLEGRQVFALNMVGEVDASLKDAGRLGKGKIVTVPNMVEKDTIRCVKYEHGCGKYARGKTDFCIAWWGKAMQV